MSRQLEPADPRLLVFSPEDVGNRTHKMLKNRKENKGDGIRTGLIDLDRELLPMLNTELITVLARPGNGKTGFLVRWARHRALELKALGKTNRVVVYITFEQSVEEINAFNVAADQEVSITDLSKGEITDQEWAKCMKHATTVRRTYPLWSIGYSATSDVIQPKLTMDALDLSLRYMVEELGLELDFIVVDYLQRIPYNRAESKTIGVSDNLDALKDLCLLYHAPVAVGAQAKREVDDYPVPIPALDDGQWTANIEQTSDKILGLARPFVYCKLGEKFGSMTVTDPSLMLGTILKQKLGPVNVPIWMLFNPMYNRFHNIELMRKQNEIDI